MTVDRRCTDAVAESRSGGGHGAFSTAETDETRSGGDVEGHGASSRSTRATLEPPMAEPNAASDGGTRGWAGGEAGARRGTLRGRDGSRFGPEAWAKLVEDQVENCRPTPGGGGRGELLNFSIVGRRAPGRSALRAEAVTGRERPPRRWAEPGQAILSMALISQGPS